MKNKKHFESKLLLAAVAFALSTWFMMGCGGGGGATAVTGATVIATPVATGSVVITVVDANDAQAIVGADVYATADVYGTTDSNGKLTLTNVPVTATQVTVSLSGYVTNYRPIDIVGRGYALTMQLTKITDAINFNPTVDNYGNVKSGYAEIDLYANNLVLTDIYSTQLPSGNVYANVTPIDPTNGFQTMPSPLTSYNAGTGTYTQLAIYGAMSVTFTDAYGASLFLKDGYTATVHVPVASGAPTPLPATLPLYFFDDVYGNWQQGGTATLDSYSTSYVGTVSHFTVWSVAQAYTATTTVTGCVQDQQGNKLARIEVDAQGNSYLGISHVTTDSYGKFSVPIQSGGNTLVFGENHSTSPILFTNVVRFNDGTSTNPIATCLVLGSNTSPSNVQIHLAWGQNPTDLDAHLTGPDGAGGRFNVYFGSPNFPSTASASIAEVNLDVDDTTSFGPEIITVRTLRAGTYQYSVHQYAGTSDIYSSPARVEATINGALQVFTPPSTGWAGLDDVWQVFSFVVDQTGTVTSVTPLNSVVNNVVLTNANPTAPAFGAITAVTNTKPKIASWPW
ncbi:MAG: hypothetical protein R8J85_09725 [Mariprofundales bacterium]